MCYISKKQYEEVLKEVVNRVKKNNINLLLSFIDIFNCFTSDTFIHYKHFGYNDAILNTKLLVEGQPSTFVYFLTEGEYEVTFNKSFYEIVELICKLDKKSKSWDEEKKYLEDEVLCNSK